MRLLQWWAGQSTQEKAECGVSSSILGFHLQMLASSDIGPASPNVIDRTGPEDMPLRSFPKGRSQGSSGLRLTRRLKDGNALSNARSGSFHQSY